MNQDSTRCGLVALVGAPNAGKSTLVNQAVGAKVSIVSHKVQTTRTRLRGVAIEGAAQVVMIDTPGVFLKPKRRLERAMVSAAWQSVEDADVVVFLFDAQRKSLGDDTQQILERLKSKAKRLILVLNKVDAIKRERLLDLAARFSAMAEFEQVFMISALKGDGVKDLMAWLSKTLPEGPWLYPEDQMSDLPLRLLAAEVTREKLFLNLHDELPYALTVETDTWETFKNGEVRIEQTVFVERDSQKQIAIGAGGKTIRKVRESAQADLKEMLEQKVHLFIFVKVREGWLDDPARYRDWGLDFNA